MMLVLTGVLGLTSVLYATARWHRAGVHFHPLFQLQLMGLNGAFLTGDLFNLFVFFEVMLAASYGLLLHGSGRARVQSGLHYIAINLVASAVFLIGIAMLYGVTGTLNLADMAQKLGAVPIADRGLLHAGVAILAIAFLAKAAMWPLGFWLSPAYAALSEKPASGENPASGEKPAPGEKPGPSSGRARGIGSVSRSSQAPSNPPLSAMC